MSALNEDYWFPWYPVHFQRDTLHLSLAEDAAYRRLIDAYMLQGQPLPDDDRALCRLVGCDFDEWMAIAKNVRAMFKTGEDGKLHKTKCDNLLNEQQKLSGGRSRAGKKGANIRWNKKKTKNGKSYGKSITEPEQTDGNANGKAMASDATKQNNTIQDKDSPQPPKGARSSVDEFDRWYAVYPLHKGRDAALKAFVKARKRASLNDLVAGAERYRDDPSRKPDYTAHPASWLNAGRWLDDSGGSPGLSDDTALVDSRTRQLIKAGVPAEEIGRMDLRAMPEPEFAALVASKRRPPDLLTRAAE